MENYLTLRPDKEREPYLTLFMKLIPLLEILLAGFGLYFLGFAEGGILGWAKLIVLLAAAYAVAYAILRMAIERGVPLVAAKSRIAGPMSGLSIAFVGACFFLVTAPGLTIFQVEESRLTAHLEQIGNYADVRVSIADQAVELVPIMQAVAEDLAARTEQESETGVGPIALAWDSLTSRAEGLSSQMTVSLGVRGDLLDRIHAQRMAMETTLADESVSIWDRRAVLRMQQARLMSLLAELDQAVPVSVVRSYASELEGGVLVPDREDANARINRTLAGYADTLMSALVEQRSLSATPPAFPSRTGALDTFAYAGKFAPVFLFAFLVDMVFPLALWAYVLMTMIAHSPQVWAKPRTLTDLDRLTGMRPMSARQMRELTDDDDDLTESTPVRDVAPPRAPMRPNGKARN
ncbi:hypothetical protein [Jannaschia sp. 2305UL9-9]|uniref:hypothetical protein n=1 Tax=Jannaschia sp. 2305UL9-9 TaxID=3121638 RepID=UPI003526F5E3